MSKKMEHHLEELVLAALFHDLGKFGQRAGAERSDNLTSTYCPSYQGRSSHLHVLNTDHFIENLLPIPGALELDRSAISKLAANHHKPDWEDLKESCLVLADHLASGADRWKSDEDEEVGEDFINSRLISILNEPELGKNTFTAKNAMRYGLHSIDDKTIPRQLEITNRKEGKTGYAEHWEAFTGHLGQFSPDKSDSNPVFGEKDLPFRHYLNALCTATERYLWCIPASSYKTLPDISLHDHGMLTAALAQALFVFHKDEGGLPDKSSKDRKKAKFLLYGGDLSGIQHYIFGINPDLSAGVAKLFRARSFYLQMITKAIVLEILERLGLHMVAQVMDAGGRFLLILPNSEKVVGLLDSFETELQEQFMRRFLGTVALNTSRIEASYEDLLLDQFADTLDRVFDGMEAQKLERFGDLFKSKEWSPVFGEWDPEGELGKGEQSWNEFESGGEEINETLYRKMRRMATDLASKDHRWFKIFKEGDGPNPVELMFGWEISMLESMPNSNDWNAGIICNRSSYGDYGLHPIAGHLPQVTPYDLERWGSNLITQLQEEDDEGVKQPVRSGDPKTFQMLALSGKNTKGKAFIGVLKADVDNLGLLFSQGLRESKNRVSISRFASLSRMLNHYFSQGLLKMVQEEFPDLYVVFSGGDDLFFLGPWQDVLKSSLKIRSTFGEFAAENPDLTLSAGIGVFKPTLPIRDLARRAETLLELSKNFRTAEGEKDAVTVFDDTVDWKTFKRLLEMGEWLSRQVEQEQFNTGFLHRVLHYGRQARLVESGEVRAAIYRAHLSYDLARNIEKKVRPEVYEKLNGWLVSEDFRQHSSIPLHYALYMNRT